MRGDDRPARRLDDVIAKAAADDVRQGDKCRIVAVIALRGCEAALAVQEPLELALGVVEPAGAGPSIGAREDRLIAMRVTDAGDFGRDPVQCLVPRDLNETVLPALFAALSRPPFEPALANGRPQHAGAARKAAGDVVVDGGWIEIAGMGLDGFDRRSVRQDPAQAPVV